MRDPDDHAKAREHPRVAGGKATERLKMFYLARGITEDPVAHSSGDYSAAVLAAITAAEAAAQNQANLPQWYFLGPDLMANGQSAGSARVSVSGRLSAVAVDPSNPDHLLVGAGAGGIWESFSGGGDWAPRTDFARTLTTGAIAFDPGNAKNATRIVYAGTGEGNQYWYLGQGILKSTDGGTTWSVLAGSPFAGKGFFAIIVDPANSQHLLAATRGLAAVAAVAAVPAAGTTPAVAAVPAVPATGGVYQSLDGGQTWTQVYAARVCWDMSMQTVSQPDGTQVTEVLAATPDGLIRSADGGTTWAAVTPLWDYSANALQRMAVSHSPKDPTVAFAFAAFTNPDPELSSYPVPYLWRRSGGTWSAIAIPTTTTTLTVAGVKKSKTVSVVDSGQAGYDWYVAAAPDNTGQVYLGAKDVFRDDLQADGLTWTLTNVSSKSPGDDIHSDQHAIAFDPGNPAIIYCAGDGGLYRSPDRGTTWFSLNTGLGITEVEYMVHDNQNRSWLLAGTQDNGSIRYLGTSAFEHVADGDGGDCGIDQTRTNPTTPPTCYHTYYNTNIERSTTGGGWKSWTNIATAAPLYPYPSSLFYPPVGVAGSTVAIAGASVYVSRDTGTTWNTVNFPATDQTAAALYLTSSDLIYAASTTGRVCTIAYANGAWPATATELTRPRRAYVSAIRVDPSNRIWVTMSQVGDGTAGNGQVFRSDDQGKTWTDKTGYDPDPTRNLPRLPITSIAFDNTNGDRIWVSADVGVYESLDGGTTWAPFFQNLPYVIVEDLEFQPQARVLRAGTRARGVWEVAVGTPGPSVPAPSPKACSVQRNSGGGMEVFAVRPDGIPQHIFQNERHTFSEPVTGWQGWMPLGSGPNSPATSTGLIAVTSPLAAGAHQDGRLAVFGRARGGGLGINSQTTPNNDWAGWFGMGGFLTGNPVVAANQDGRLEVFARGHDGALWHTAQSPANSNSWSASTSLGGVFLTAPPAAGTAPPVPAASGTIASAPAAALNSDGRLFVFARATDGTLAIITQTSPSSSSSWSAWTSLGGTLAGSPVVQRGQDGHLEVFARGPGGALAHIYQTAPGGAWSAWESLGGTFAGDPAIIPNRNGGMHAWVRWTDNTLRNIGQSGPYGGWSGWNPVPVSGPPPLSSDPVGISDQDGSMNVFVRAIDNALWQLHQYAPAPGWQWGSLGGTFTAFPAP